MSTWKPKGPLWPYKVPFTVDEVRALLAAREACDDGDECPGWAVFNGAEIQRCDTCCPDALDDAAPEWYAIRGAWTTPRLGCGMEMRPGVMVAGITSEPERGRWEQTSIALATPEIDTGTCSDRYPCALHRGRVPAMTFALRSAA